MPKLSCPWRVKITCLLTVNICRHMGWAMAYFTYGKNKPQCNHCGMTKSELLSGMSYNNLYSSCPRSPQIL